MKYGHNWPSGASEQKLFETVNSWDLETKFKGHPLALIYFMFLVIKVCVPNLIHKPSTVLEKSTYQYFSHMNA